MLILAGIAIASLTGDNGLFARAKQARQNTLDAQNKENTTLEGYEDKIDEIIGGAEITGVDTSVTNPVEAMPTGATVIQGNASEGIVIRDENGNEWVWVEVPRTIEVYPNVGINLDVENITDEQCNAIYEDLAKYASAYRQNGFEDIFYSKEQSSFTDANAYNIAKNNMLKSVYKNGGFWIGRYEVGIENSYRSYGEYGQDYTSEHPITETPVIKVNAYPYNYVTCSQAQTLSQQLSTGGKSGSLMFGIQWDLTCKFLEKSGLTTAQINSNSTDWGNYLNVTFDITRGKYFIMTERVFIPVTGTYEKKASEKILLTTGTTERNKKMNIYDLAGNVFEFTLEKSIYTEYPCTNRGGSYTDDGTTYSVTFHNGVDILYNGASFGFRASLY